MSGCNCKSEIEAKLTERFKAAKPEASEHSVELQGYGFSIMGSAVELKPFMAYKYSAAFPHKRGDGESFRTKTGNMVFSFCPFCGTKIGGAA